MSPEVRAAGGVVWRPTKAGGREVALVHRPRYDDWSLPKGKLEPGEGFPAAAVREVMEETGLQVDLGDYLREISYVDQQGRDKVVRYWAMRARGGSFTPNAEVDDLRWVEESSAGRQLSYRRDCDVLSAFATTAGG